MTYISERIRKEVILRSKGRCEYCQTQQVIVVTEDVHT